MSELPLGWVDVELGQVVDPKQTRNPRTDGSKSFRYIDVQAVDNARNRVGVASERPSQSAPSRARRLVRTNDVLFCLVRPYLRNIALVPRELDGQVASTAFCVLRPNGALASRFLFHQVLRASFVGDVPTYGTSPPAAREDEFLKQRIGLAPLPEQHRIVARIESLFARLDDGTEALRRTQANLQRYRASVIKAAVEGKLTERWRNKNPPKETGAELLGRILAERQRRWEEEQLAKFDETGRRPPKNWKLRYKEPVGPDTSKLPELPDSWCWATVDQLASSMTNGIYKPARFYSEDGTPCLRMYNIVNGELALDKLKRMVLSEDEVRRYGLICGDLLINRVNTRELVGKAAAIPDGLNDIVFESKNIRLRLIGMGYEPRFLAYCFFVLGPAYFGRHSQQVVGMASISQGQVGRLIVPVPPGS